MSTNAEVTELPEFWPFLEEMIDSGVESQEYVLAHADYLAEAGEIDGVTARRLAQEAWDRRVAAEAEWPTVTDGDRVGMALAWLESLGIATGLGFEVSPCDDHVSGRNTDLFDYPRVCVVSVPSVHSNVPQGSVDLRCRCVDDDHPRPDGEQECVCTHEAACRALGMVGLQYEWDGHSDSTVTVTGLDWKWRLPRCVCCGDLC